MGLVSIGVINPFMDIFVSTQTEIPRRSTLSDANARRSEKFFEDVYRDLYEDAKSKLTSDSRRGGQGLHQLRKVR